MATTPARLCARYDAPHAGRSSRSSERHVGDATIRGPVTRTAPAMSVPAARCRGVPRLSAALCRVGHGVGPIGRLFWAQESIVSHRLWRLVAGTIVSLGLLWLAARGVSWAEVTVALRSARWNLIAVAAVFVVLATALRAWCWQRLLVATEGPVTFVRARRGSQAFYYRRVRSPPGSPRSTRSCSGLRKAATPIGRTPWPVYARLSHGSVLLG